RLTDWVQVHGQGYALTPEGSAVLQSPRALARLRAGKLEAAPAPRTDGVRGERQGMTPWSRGEAAREAIVHPSKPVVTYALRAINLFVFVRDLSVALQTMVPVQCELSGS